MIKFLPSLQSLAPVSLLGVSILISACGGGGSSSSDSASMLSDNTVDLVTSEFSGSVGDGPIVGATLRIYDKDNSLVQTVVSDSNAHYSTRIKTKGNAYPLTIVVEDGTDLVTGLAPDFRMTSVVSHPSVKNANITPFTTLIVESAGSMPGGLNSENISAAHAAIMEQLNFGLDPVFVADPIVTQITDENAAVVTKASEVLGEMIRRTRDQLLVMGSVVSADDVVNAIADDITDGSMDGLGANRANGRISAVSTVVSAQVLIEALSNNLKVNGVRATDKLDAAIAGTRPSAPAVTMTGEVRINRGMLVQVRRAVAAARVLSPSIELTTIANTLDNIQDNSLPSDIEPVLPADTSTDLDAAVALALFATEEQLEAVNNMELSAVPGGNSGAGNSGNVAPTISGSAAGSVNAGTLYSFQPTASDPDGDSLVFSILGRPPWATFDSTTGRLSGTPGANDAGTYSNIVISVSDRTTSSSHPAFSIVVNANIPGNTAPTITGMPAASVAEDSTYQYRPVASDADGDTLTFSISSKPDWASFDSATGRLSGTPRNGDVGTYSNIRINVSDGAASASIGPFRITVSNTNDAPTIGRTPATSVSEDSAYVFQPSSADADGDDLTFSISNRPSWASFSRRTGRLSGTPNNADVGLYSNITIRVSDGSASAALGAFSIRVINTNDAPTISGSPVASIDENNTYRFQPGAVDPDGDNLTFSITNRPTWASFDTRTGRLSGTPVNAGTFSNIRISVSDGQSTAALPTFAITVNDAAPQTGSLSLSWTAPVARADGTALSLSEIAGYTVYYGTSAGDYSNSIDVNGVSSTSVTITSLPVGTYYVVATTRDLNGRESLRSSMVTKLAR